MALLADTSELSLHPLSEPVTRSIYALTPAGAGRQPHIRQVLQTSAASRPTCSASRILAALGSRFSPTSRRASPATRYRARIRHEYETEPSGRPNETSGKPQFERTAARYEV